MACTWFGEICYCCRSTSLPRPAWVVFITFCKPFFRALYYKYGANLPPCVNRIVPCEQCRPGCGTHGLHVSILQHEPRPRQLFEVWCQYGGGVPRDIIEACMVSVFVSKRLHKIGVHCHLLTQVVCQEYDNVWRIRLGFCKRPGEYYEQQQEPCPRHGRHGVSYLSHCQCQCMLHLSLGKPSHQSLIRLQAFDDRC